MASDGLQSPSLNVYSAPTWDTVPGLSLQVENSPIPYLRHGDDPFHLVRGLNEVVYMDRHFEGLKLDFLRALWRSLLLSMLM